VQVRKQLRSLAFFLCACLSVLSAISLSAAAQTPPANEWLWMGGSNMASNGPPSAPGVYGTLGTPAAANIPGTRWGASDWTDSSGDFWLFGGHGVDGGGIYGYLNDLWRFSPSTGKWTWMSGSNTVAHPPQTDVQDCETGYFDCGQPGVYGTLRTPAPANIPGGRTTATSWTDNSGNLWLFGGYGFGAFGTGGDGELNDLWMYNPTTNEWTWMGGANTAPVDCNGWPGVYGTLGTPAAGNAPGGREGSVIWTDGGDNLWLFGGWGFTVNFPGYLNDLWKFDPSSKEWAWMAGSSTANPTGVHGELGTPSAGTVPGGRWVATSWTDSSGNLWLFGGQGYDANSYFGYLNDLWELNISTNPVQWTWMGGSSAIPPSCAGKEVVVGGTDFGLLNCGQPGLYGSIGIPDATNVPGGRDTDLALRMRIS